MRKGRLSALILSLAVMAMPAHAENITGDTAVLRALDKVTAITADFNVKVGDTLKFGSLDIVVSHCEKKPPEETPETFVFLQVTDRGVGSEITSNKPSAQGVSTADNNSAGDRLFSGWMFASSPALSALEHPVYDVWPLDCLAPPTPKLESLEAE